MSFRTYTLVCGEYINQNPNKHARETIQAEFIDICPSVPLEYKNRILTFLMKYTDLPHTLKDTPPHTFKLKEDATATLVRTGRSKFGKDQDKIINDWVKWTLVSNS